MVLTIFVVYQIYRILNSWVIDPVAKLIIPHGIESPAWSVFDKFLTPIVSLSAVLLMFYFLGYAFQTRISRWVDWIFSSIPECRFCIERFAMPRKPCKAPTA